MPDLEEATAVIDNAGSAVDNAATAVRAADLAREKEQQAAALGIDGMTTTIQAARETFEAALSGLS